MSSESSKAGNAPSEDTAFLVQKVLECYTTRSAQTLNALYHEVFDTSSTFLDPFVEASPRQEGLLQFFALQRIFSKIVATPNSKAGTLSTDLVHPDSDTKCIRSDCSFQYFWFKEGRFAQWLLPDKTDVEATVCLTVSQSTGKVRLELGLKKRPLNTTLH